MQYNKNPSYNRGVLTSYVVNGTQYSSYILGQTIPEIKKKAKSRNLNEKIESSIQEIETMQDFSKMGDYEFLLSLPEITHTACYLSFVALMAKKISIEEVIGDNGILHEIAHLMTKTIPVTPQVIKEVRYALTQLQCKAVGLY